MFPDISKLDLLLGPKGKAKGLCLSLLLGHQFYHKGARADLRIIMKRDSRGGRGFVRLRQERKGKEDLKNREVSHFSVWEAGRKKK